MMAARVRCGKACEECKRRKERCDGLSPCLLCARRERADACVFATASPGQSNSAISHKRRRFTSPGSPSNNDLSIAHLPVLHRSGEAPQFFTGSSGTLAFIKTVGCCFEGILASHRFPASCKEDFLVEETSKTRVETDFRTIISVNDDHELVQQFLISIKGIFDLFDEIELLQQFSQWEAPCRDRTSLQDVIYLLVMAIGAQQRADTGDEELGESLFLEAQTVATRAMLDPPSILSVQTFVLLALYLFVTFRRNAAFSHLGVATRAAETIGLNRLATIASLPHADQIVWTRAWKSIRILDVSSCASLGRSLTTRDRNRGRTERLKPPGVGKFDAIAAQIDSTSMQLCDIADSILVEVYESDRLTVDLAAALSKDLRDWTQHLPDILDPFNVPQIHPEANLPEALCLNALTCAYYWTIQLLTRPFLLASVRSKQKSRDEPTLVDGIPSYSTYVDACINSALRCIEVTSQLMEYKSLPKKLFLVNNTTLVSALVLGLAMLGDHDQHFPLQSGLQKALGVLQHMSKDPQARHYATIVAELMSAGETYIEQRNAKKLALRSAQVEQMFGSVHEKHISARNADHLGHDHNAFANSGVVRQGHLGPGSNYSVAEMDSDALSSLFDDRDGILHVLEDVPWAWSLETAHTPR